MLEMISWILANKLLLLFFAATASLAASTFVISCKYSNLSNNLKPSLSPTTALSLQTTTQELPNMENYRLPSEINPQSYELTLYPDLKTGLFKGILKSVVFVKIIVSCIKMHSKDLTISKITINGKDAKVQLDEKYELVIISNVDSSEIPPGNYTITINYEGDMKNRIVGLYTSSYTDEAKEKR